MKLMASSMSLTVTMGSTGPKISSCISLEWGGTSFNTVGAAGTTTKQSVRDILNSKRINSVDDWWIVYKLEIFNILKYSFQIYALYVSIYGTGNFFFTFGHK